MDIKWFNDILINGKKIVGILIEMQVEEDCVWLVIIGIGINVNQQFDDFLDELKDIVISFS